MPERPDFPAPDGSDPSEPSPGDRRPASGDRRPASGALGDGEAQAEHEAATVPDPESPLRDPALPSLQPELTGPADDQVILGHKYDGIREYDNPMPGWWVGLFWASMAFMPVYALGVHTFGWFDTYEEDLAQAQADLEATREAYRASGGFDVSPAALAEYVGDDVFVAAGQANFAVCAACHGQQGEGLIGPNLADPYWIHGGSPADVYEILEVGVPEKGMPAWDTQFSEEERAQITAFVMSLQGTDPPGAKAPEGELEP